PVDHARPERKASALAHRNRRVARGERVLELAHEPSLAHAGLAHDGDEVRRGVANHAREQHLQRRELVVATDERRLAAGAARPARLLLERAESLPGGYRLGLALQRPRLERHVLP